MKTPPQQNDDQNPVVRLIALKRYETMSDESRKRIRAGVLREIRSPEIQPGFAGSLFGWGSFKWAVSAAALLLFAAPLIFQGPGPLKPVTAFTASDSEGSLVDVPIAPLSLASNEAPANLQFAPVEGVPVNYQR